jgi:hypothetical protein
MTIYKYPSLTPAAGSITSSMLASDINLSKWVLVTSGAYTNTNTPFNLTGLTSRKRFKLVIVNTTISSGDALKLQFNGDTGTNYAWTRTLESSTASGTGATGVFCMILTPSITTQAEIYIITGQNKKAVTTLNYNHDGSTSARAYMGGYHNDSAATITAIKGQIESTSTATGTYALYYDSAIEAL